MNTLFVGQKRINLDSVDSTNKYLANHENLTDLPEGTVVVAHAQLGGKGQRNKVWHSEPGKNLTASVLLRPKFLNAQNYFILNKGVTLAVLNTIEHFSNQQVWIKWPNDTIVKEKKIAGILVELNWRGALCQNAIIGIGLNVNQVEFQQLPNAISLKKLVSNDIALDHVLTIFCQNLEHQYLKIRKKEWDAIILAYNDKLWDREEKITFDHNENSIQGMLVGVNNDGKLRMIVNGKEMAYSNGEIRLNYKFK